MVNEPTKFVDGITVSPLVKAVSKVYVPLAEEAPKRATVEVAEVVATEVVAPENVLTAIFVPS